MTDFANKAPKSNNVLELRRTANENIGLTAPTEGRRPRSDYNGMRLIPWRDIWASLTVAKIRGNGEMIEVFYDTLFKEAVFDDRGAWSIDLRKRN